MLDLHATGNTVMTAIKTYGSRVGWSIAVLIVLGGIWATLGQWMHPRTGSVDRGAGGLREGGMGASRGFVAAAAEDQARRSRLVAAVSAGVGPLESR